MATPYALVFRERTSSTQDDARHLMGSFPTLVVAAEQDAGRGRSGSAWRNAPSALAASLAFRPTWPPETWPRITLMAGLAAVRALEPLRPGAALGLKWPNDVLLGDRKVAGVLTEATGDLVVAGCGVNLAWPDPPEGVGAVLTDTPAPEVRIDVAQRWAEVLLAWLEAPPDRWPRAEYRDRCVTLGRAITWEPDGSGRAVDVQPDGSLEVDSGAGPVTVSAGAVHQVRDAGPVDGGPPGGH